MSRNTEIGKSQNFKGWTEEDIDVAFPGEDEDANIIRSSALDTPISVTKFFSKDARKKSEHTKSLRDLAPIILRRVKPEKSRLPWLKLARFGNIHSMQGSLRHNGNVLEVTGIEGDHDASTMSIVTAAKILSGKGVAALIYTSPSNTGPKPRWRVLCPLSRPVRPNERERLCARLNGLLEGALAPESFILSQSYYYGRVGENVSHYVELVEGIALDLLSADVDEWALGKDGRPYKQTNSRPEDGSNFHCTGPASGAIDVNMVLSALNAIPQDARDNRELCWRPIGMALHQATAASEEGFVLWDEWSQPCSSYDPDDQRRVWDSFGSYAGRPLSIGTLFHMAKGHGWVRPEPEYGSVLQRSRSGAPLSNLHNALAMMRADPALRGLLGFDQMQSRPMLMQAVPRFPEKSLTVNTPPRRLTDRDVTALREYLQAAGLTALPAGELHLAVDARAQECAFHPVCDYLHATVWDGVERLSTWLTTYLGAEATSYTGLIGRMFLIAMVARVIEPGCKMDYVPILESIQGAGKSATCRILGGQWFSDSLPDLEKDPVRVSMHLRGKWLIEIAELSAMSKAEASTLKAFITRDVEEFTPKHARTEVREPRQCVFIGTTNPEGAGGYLKDGTGGRRFWPIKVGDALDLKGLALNRDQLFAEAVAAFKAGENWWPTVEFEREHMAPEQEGRRENDQWVELIRYWLEGNEEDRRWRRVTLAEVAMQALGIEAARLTMPVQHRISKCLKEIGWKQGRNKSGRWWEIDL